MFKNMYMHINRTLITKSGMLSTPTDLDGLRVLTALKASESETGATDKMTKGRGRQQDKGGYVYLSMALQPLWTLAAFSVSYLYTS
jgi:hypothetical protein